MKIKEVAETLEAIGWHTYISEGDRVAQFELPDRVVDIIYSVRRATSYEQLGSMLSVSTNAFSSTCRRIENGHDKYAPLIVSWKRLLVRDVEAIREEHVRQISKQAIDWAKEQDLQLALLNHAALPTIASGARPIWHLAALALLGETEKLKFYQASFEVGNRLGFVPYITKDFIDRAVTIAEQNTSL